MHYNLQGLYIHQITHKMELITIKNLFKKYENLTAVQNLNLTIQENEVFGLLGPNGAGKTTTIHMLATLLKPHPESYNCNK